MQKERKGIRVELPKELIGGVYSNNMAVTHTKEEFIMDFLMITTSYGAVTSRVIVSPGHIKRIVQTLQENIHRYEAEFGTIETAEGHNGHITLQ